MHEALGLVRAATAVCSVRMWQSLRVFGLSVCAPSRRASGLDFVETRRIRPGLRDLIGQDVAGKTHASLPYAARRTEQC